MQVPIAAPRAVPPIERHARAVIDPAVPDRGSLDNEIARLRGLDVGEGLSWPHGTDLTTSSQAV